jgi:hypothetical protein
MLFVKSLFNWYENQYKPKETSEVYSSIDDLPQWNWVQIHKTGNLAFIKKLDNYRDIETDNSLVLEQLWLQIYDEYLKEFGLSKEYKEILERKKQIARMKNEFITTNNRSLLNFIKIEELELEATFDKTEVRGFESVVIGIEKIQGIKLEPKKITVYEYNNYLRTLNKE